MASSGVTYCPRTVYAVTMPDKSLWPEPVVFYREDQADALAAAVDGAEAFEVRLHMWRDGEETVARLAAAANEEPSKFVFLQISREGAESFVSDSPGWGAMGLQEITEAIMTELSKGKCDEDHTQTPKDDVE